MPTIREMLSLARSAGASDLHITAGASPRMRINGELIPMDFARMLPEEIRRLLEEIADDGQRKIFEEKGELDMSFSIRNEGRYRMNAYRQRGSVAIAIRIVGTQIPSPQELGVPAAVLELSRKKRGLVLVTGPAGSGKSTTLAAVVDRINRERECHIITLEDPIEYLHHHGKALVNQREIGLDCVSYQSAMRSALKEDPDVILIGELRDYETISHAVMAAQRGHLVLSALHTVGASDTMECMVDVFPPHQQQQIRVQLSNVLEAVVSQQLLPRADSFGRVTAFEVLLLNQALRGLLREGKYHQLMSMMQAGRGSGMLAMDDSIVRLYHEGKISRQTAVSYASNPEGMESRLF